MIDICLDVLVVNVLSCISRAKHHDSHETTTIGGLTLKVGMVFTRANRLRPLIIRRTD